MKINQILSLLNFVILMYIAVTAMVIRGKSAAILAGIKYKSSILSSVFPDEERHLVGALDNSVNLSIDVIPSSFDIMFKLALCSALISLCNIFLSKTKRAEIMKSD